MRSVWDPIIVAFLVTRLALTRLPLDPPHRPYRLQARDESAQQPRFRRRFSRRRGGDAYRREIWSRSRPDGSIFNASTGGNNTIEVKLKQFIISKTFNAGFPLSLMAKDVRTADVLARAIEVPTPLADLCVKLCDDAPATLGEQGRPHRTLLQYQ